MSEEIKELVKRCEDAALAMAITASSNACAEGEAFDAAAANEVAKGAWRASRLAEQEAKEAAATAFAALRLALRVRGDEPKKDEEKK